MRFPHAEDAGGAGGVAGSRSSICLEGGPWEHPWRVYDLDELSTVEVDHLVEQGLMTPALRRRLGRGPGLRRVR